MGDCAMRYVSVIVASCVIQYPFSQLAMQRGFQHETSMSFWRYIRDWVGKDLRTYIDIHSLYEPGGLSHIDMTRTTKIRKHRE